MDTNMAKRTAYWTLTRDRIAAGRLDETDWRIVQAVRNASDGISGGALRHLIGLGASTMNARTCALKDAHLIKLVGVGRYSRWVAPNRQEEVAEMLYRKHRAEAAAYGPHYLRKFDARHKRAAEVEVLQRKGFGDEPTQRVISAAGAPPIATKAPRSVWDFAMGAAGA